MTGVHRLQHVERLAASAFTHDDAIGPHAQRVLDQIPDGDGPLVKQLERLGVPVLVLSPQRHADVARTLARLARVLGLPPAIPSLPPSRPRPFRWSWLAMT